MELTYEQRYNELATILTNTDYSITERGGLAILRIEAHKRPAQQTRIGSYALFDDLTVKVFADKTGLSESTAGDLLRKYEAGGLIDRKTESVAVNRYGVEIPRESMNQARGDRFQASTQIAMSLEPITSFPPLPEAPRAERARHSSAQFRKVAKELMEMACPECGAVGKWHLACGECGSTWTADELASLENPTVESFHCRTTGQNLPDISPAGEISGEISTKGGDISASVAIVNTPSVTESVELPHSPRSTTQGAQVDILPPLSAYSETPAHLATDPAIDDGRVVLQGASTVRFFDELDTSFCLVEPKGKKAINPRDDWGDELSWIDTPITGAAAELHLARGGNVGLLTGRGQIGFIDIDDDLPGFLVCYPLLATLPRITRDNAPDRAKLLIILADDTIRSHTYKGSLHKLELLALGNQGVVAGTHETGATISLTIGDLVQFTQDKLDAMAREWTGTTREITPTVKRALQSRPADASFVRDVFRWANQQPGYQAEAAQLRAACRHQGDYVAVRPDDRTPSAKLDHDAYAEQYGPTLHDYGTGEKWDVCETISRLRPIDKRILLWDELVPEYKRMHEPVKES